MNLVEYIYRKIVGLPTEQSSELIDALNYDTNPDKYHEGYNFRNRDLSKRAFGSIVVEPTIEECTTSQELEKEVTQRMLVDFNIKR